MRNEIERQILQHMDAEGVKPRGPIDFIFDGKIHRYCVEGCKTNKDLISFIQQAGMQSFAAFSMEDMVSVNSPRVTIMTLSISWDSSPSSRKGLTERSRSVTISRVSTPRLQMLQKHMERKSFCLLAICVSTSRVMDSTPSMNVFSSSVTEFTPSHHISRI